MLSVKPAMQNYESGTKHNRTPDLFDTRGQKSFWNFWPEELKRSLLSYSLFSWVQLTEDLWKFLF